MMRLSYSMASSRKRKAAPRIVLESVVGDLAPRLVSMGMCSQLKQSSEVKNTVRIQSSGLATILSLSHVLQNFDVVDDAPCAGAVL